MKSKIINKEAQTTFALIFETGDEVIQKLTQFARENNLSASSFTAIGAFSHAVLGFFDFSIKDYRKIKIDTQVEVLSLSGDIAFSEGQPKVHAHVVVGKPDGQAFGGHVLEAYVHPTLEVILVESPAYLQREVDKETGLALIRV